jgi:hypothetical protein
MKTAFEFHPSPNTSSRLLALALLLFLGLSAAPRAGAQSYVLSNLWSVAAGSPTHPFLQDDDRTRGLAYNPVTGHVLVVSRTSSNAVTCWTATPAPSSARCPTTPTSSAAALFT